MCTSKNYSHDQVSNTPPLRDLSASYPYIFHHPRHTLQHSRIADSTHHTPRCANIPGYTTTAKTAVCTSQPCSAEHHSCLPVLNPEPRCRKQVALLGMSFAAPGPARNTSKGNPSFNHEGPCFYVFQAHELAPILLQLQSFNFKQELTEEDSPLEPI